MMLIFSLAEWIMLRLLSFKWEINILYLF